MNRLLISFYFKSFYQNHRFSGNDGTLNIGLIQSLDSCYWRDLYACLTHWPSKNEIGLTACWDGNMRFPRNKRKKQKLVPKLSIISDSFPDSNHIYLCIYFIILFFQKKRKRSSKKSTNKFCIVFQS